MLYRSMMQTAPHETSSSAHPMARLFCLMTLLVAAAPSQAAKAPVQPPKSGIVALRVAPAALVLENGRDLRRVLVSGRRADGSWEDLSASAVMRAELGKVRVDGEGF